LRELIHAHAGIRLNETKWEMVVQPARRRLRALHITSFGSYVKCWRTRITRNGSNFVNALTTNQTAFFREAYHFPILAEHLGGCVPE